MTPKPKFDFFTTCNVHDIINEKRLPPHTTCYIVGARYTGMGDGTKAWEYYVLITGKYNYQWLREENLSKEIYLPNTAIIIPQERRSFQQPNAHIIVSEYEIYEDERWFESFSYLQSNVDLGCKFGSIRYSHSGFLRRFFTKNKNYMNDEIQTFRDLTNGNAS